MNIWYISKYASTPEFGMPTRQYFFSKYFAKHGHNVTLVSSRSNGQSYNITSLGLHNHKVFYIDNITHVLINGSKVKLGFNLNRVFSWFFFEVRLSIWGLFYKRDKPDIIIISSLSLFTILTGILFKYIYKSKLIFEIRDIWPLTLISVKGWSKSNLIIKTLQFIECLGYKKADIIVGSMPNLKEHVDNLNVATQNKVCFIPTGFDPDFYNESVNKVNATIFFSSIPNDHFKVMYAGTIGLVNCVDEIIDSAKFLKNEKISFIIIGNGSQKKQLVNYCQKENLTNVHFIDKVPKLELQSYLYFADVVLNPWMKDMPIYKYGISPNKWLDYMLSSKPIIVSFDGYQSIINEANAGVFIEPNNPKLLADTILNFSKKDKSELREMGTNGYNFMMENLSYEKLSIRYIDMFKI